MSRTCYIRLWVCLFLLFATGQGQVTDHVRFTPASWDNIRINEPFNISWKFIGFSYPVTFDLVGRMDAKYDTDDYCIGLGATIHDNQHYWIWVPTPDLFDYPYMAEWTRTRLWYVEITAFKDPGNPGINMTDRSPEFLIAPALNQGMTDSTTTVHSTSPLTSTTATSTPTTANPTSVIPTKTPEEDPTSGHDNLSAGAKAGIGLGCGVLVVSVVVVMVFAILRHRRKAQERQLTLFSGSAVNDKSRANIADMIPACPSCVLAERNNPSPVYELDGSAPSPAELPCSIPGSSDLQGYTPEPVEPPGSPSQPVKNQDLISPAGSPNTPASPRETTGKVGLPENKSYPIHPDDPDWKYDPVRGSYGGQSQTTE